MTREEAIAQLKMDRDLANFNPMTGEEAPMDEDCRKSAEALDMAIKALEKEPCDDVISRAEAEAIFRNARSKLNPFDYKTADEFNTRDLMLLNAEQLIHLLPSVKPQEPKWIPVSERLPNIGETVLCQCQANIYEVLKLTVDGWYHDNEHCYMEGFVIAWQPLPQPYKAESEE